MRAVRERNSKLSPEHCLKLSLWSHGEGKVRIWAKEAAETKLILTLLYTDTSWGGTGAVRISIVYGVWMVKLMIIKT